ncbi:hypothetical protein [Streptacidiphilus albus]|uniref:hypothetical protein n=1 Tax=Streptacidiphilus albus TaxID=105425 RepID=UPI00054B4DAE|nr:hypothetical protein [Streptacidiphilus albus]
MTNPLLGSLADAFTESALNTTMWNASSTGVVLAARGRVSVPATSVPSALGAAGPFEATGQALTARVTPAPGGTGGQVVQTVMRVQADAADAAYLLCQPGTGVWQAVVVNAGVATTVTLPTYDPVAHAWWAMAESSGSWLFYISPDGAAWTQVASIAYTWSPHAVSAYISAGSTAAAGQAASVEHVNTLVGASSLMPSWPQVRFGVAFNSNASNATTPYWTDLTARLRGPWSAEQSGRQYELDEVQSGQLTLSLWNLDGALDAGNASSVYAPNLLPMRPCQLTATWPVTRNLLPQSLATGSSLAYAEATAGTLSTAVPATASPVGTQQAITWVIPASTAAGAAALGLGETVSVFTSSDPAAVPVTAGSTWTGSVYLTASASIGLVPTITWYGLSGAALSSTTAATVSVAAGAWVRAVVSGTAPVGAVWARISVANAAAVSALTTVSAMGWQFEVGTAVSPWVAPGVTYPLWAGYVERWPQQWDMSGTYGTADLTCVDVLASLSDFTLQPNVESQLLSMGPDRLYPLDEPAGATSWRDLTGKHGHANLGNSTAGAGSVTSGSSITGTGFEGGTGPVTTIANPAPTIAQEAGSFINLGQPNGPPSSGGWTRIICFRTTTVPASGVSMALWMASDRNGAAGAVAGLIIDSSGHVNALVANSAGASMTVAVPVYVCDGNWHMAAIILSPGGMRLDANVDGAGYFATSTSTCTPTGIVSDAIGMYVVAPQNHYGLAFSGDLAFATEIPTNQVPSFPDLAAGFSTGWAGETSAARAQRILNLSGYGGPLGTMDAVTAMGGADLATLDATSALQLVGDSENGQVYADASGSVQLAARSWRYYQSAPALLLGEQQAAGEMPYLTDIATGFDTTHIYNQVSVTNSGAPGSAQYPTALAPNAASSAAYAPRTLSRTINVLDQTVPQYAANYLAQQYGQPLARVAQLTIDLASNPALWSQALSLGFGSRVQVTRRPPPQYGAPPVVLQQFLEQLTWNGDDQGNLKASLQLSSATPFLNWWVVSSLHSTLQVQATASTNTITLGPLTGASLNPASAVLTPGTVLTVGQGTFLAETVTVLSVAPTAAGYTSVVVSLTTNLVSTHAVGSVVCQPLGSAYTLPALPASTFPASLDAGATLSATGPRITY